METNWKLRKAGWGILFLGGALLLGWVIMTLWNWLVPALFHGPEITYLQAAGLWILSKLLLGGHGYRRSGCGHGGWRRNWRERYEEKLAGMTPEEREKFRNKMYSCGWDCNENPEGKTTS